MQERRILSFPVIFYQKDAYARNFNFDRVQKTRIKFIKPN